LPWSRNGKQLFLAKGDVTSDVVLISNFHWHMRFLKFAKF
jgi:hypothetical protein